MAYQPAGNTTSSAGLAHLANVYYRKKGLDRLQKKFVFRDVLDAEFSNASQSLLGTFTRVADLRNSRSQLQANDVLPMEDGEFFAIFHPFSTYDIVNDPAAGGLADIFKYTQPEKQPLVKYEDRGL